MTEYHGMINHELAWSAEQFLGLLIPSMIYKTKMADPHTRNKYLVYIYSMQWDTTH